MTGFQVIEKRGGGGNGKKKAYGSGKETIRFKADGTAAIQTNEEDETTQTGIDAINILLDTFMGINDTELATQVIIPSLIHFLNHSNYLFLFLQIWELGVNKTNSMDFAEAIDNSDLEAFGFTDDFIIELWGAITDARQGRIRK